MTFIWNRIHFPKIDPHLYGQLIFNKGAKLDNSMEKRVFSIIRTGTTRYGKKLWKKINLDPHFTPYKY